MADRPILFSTSMIRALLDGRKTMTRRIIKKQAALDAIAVFGPDFLLKPGNSDLLKYSIGDRLWVRERLTQRQMTNFLTGDPTSAIVAAYVADDADVVNHYGFNICPWWDHPGKLSSIYMPRWASRFTLTVSGVKVEHLQDISEADAIAEGIKKNAFGTYPVIDEDAGLTGLSQTPRGAFGMLWESINGPSSWSDNPWVAAYSFDVHPTNIDSMEA